MEQLAFEAFGVTVAVAADDAATLEAARAILPPGSAPADPGGAQTTISLEGDQIHVDGEPTRSIDQWGSAVQALDAVIRSRLGALAPHHVFVHAGAVAADGRAIVIPGRSMAGKSTLVAALVHRGAAYLSDEFAVLDAEGRVHPYPKPLSLRPPGRTWQADVDAGRLGTTADEAHDVGLIAITHYREGATWQPARRTPAEGAMALLQNALPARERPRQTLTAVQKAAANAVVLEGARGSALETAVALLTVARDASDG